MAFNQNLFKKNQVSGALTEKQDSNLVRVSNSKFSLETAIAYIEIANQAAHEYYKKASGCSVKEQKDNLFDYYLRCE